MIALPERVTRALAWLIPLLQREQIPYQISGGLAAKLYGSPRDVNDIDIDIPDEALPRVAALAQPFIIYGPAHYTDERWDLQMMTLNYYGQDIDVCGCHHTRICDATTSIWTDWPTDLAQTECVAVGDLQLCIIPKRMLASYKKMLVGAHQQVDIAAVEQSMREEL